MAALLKEVFGALPTLADLDDVTCAVCLEIYDKPKIISCGHTFCTRCLSNYNSLADPACPLCRQPFKPNDAAKAADIERLLRYSKAACNGCKGKFQLNKLQQHQNSCDKYKLLHPIEAENASGAAPADPVVSLERQEHIEEVPNRHTFKCPYCGLANLDCSGLLRHVNDEHRNNPTPVVCPICASMPWGDPEQTSSNFVSHINLRHKFEYDTLVDYRMDEQATLEMVLKASLEEQ